MRKSLFLIAAALLTLSGVGNAQSVTMTLGYCDGQYNIREQAAFGSDGKNAWVSGAMYVPAEVMNTYAGNTITSATIGLSTRQYVDSVRIWVRQSLDGPDLAVAALSRNLQPKLLKGKNTVTFDEPYVVPAATDGLYFGYSYLQQQRTNALSVLNQPQANGLFVQTTDGQWTDRSTEGVLCMEVTVEGNSLPQHDVALTELTANDYFIVDQGTLHLQATVSNLALETVETLKAVCCIDGYDEELVADIPAQIAYGEQQTVDFDLHPTLIDAVPDGQLSVSVVIAALNGNEDQNPSDNTLSTSFHVAAHAYERTVLIEEFTTEPCSNCPRVAIWLHQALEYPELAGRAVAVEHHAGYYTDYLTTDMHEDYIWFYGGGSFAPALMFDRSPASERTPVITIYERQELPLYIAYRASQPAFVDLQLRAQMGDDEQLSVTVDGDLTETSDHQRPERLTVFLVEDNLEAREQVGITSTTTDFVHHNVTRMANATWGDPIDWQANHFSYACTFNVPDDYVRENLSLVAFASDYDAASPVRCQVYNAAALAYSDIPNLTGIVEHSATTTAAPEAYYYTLDGRRVSQPGRGLFITRSGKKAYQE